MSDKVLLNIGCGTKKLQGYINVDAVPNSNVDIVANDLKAMPFDDNSADLVYMCHVLEHVKREDVILVIAEMWRILKPGGVLRVSVPGFDKLVNFYNNAGKCISSIELQLMGGQNHEYNFHYSIFNMRRLTGLFIEAGFDKVDSWDPFNCEYHDFKDRASREISLNVEGTK